VVFSIDKVYFGLNNHQLAMTKQLEVIDLAKAFGKQNFVIQDGQYKTKLANHPLVQGLWTVGRYFVLVSNTHTWNTELVSGDCLQITGHQPEEVESMNAEFVMNYTIQADLPFNLNVVKLGMQYLNQIPKDEREFIYAVYFYRAQKKDGQIITVQQQSIPVLFDENRVPYIFSNIFTDITYLGVSNIPQALMVNKATDEIFHIQPHLLDLVKTEEMFTVREKEVIQLLINGNNSRQIGHQLFISMETVRTHRKNILKKSGLKTTAELVGYALTHGIV
jgi:DNA-binding CsgD family transcriptional regulator